MKYTFHVDKKETIQPKNIFIALWGTEEDCNPGMVMVYAPIGQHSEAYVAYIKNDCREITEEQYAYISRGIYTPSDYLTLCTYCLQTKEDKKQDACTTCAKLYVY